MTHTFRTRFRPGGMIAAALASTILCGSRAAIAQAADQTPVTPPPTAGAPTSPPPTTPPTGATPEAGAPVQTAPMSAADQAQWDPIQAAINRQDYPTAERLLRAWLTTHQDDRHAQFLLGYALTFQNKNSEALDVFNTLVTADPENPDYLFGKATTLVRAGRAADAIPILDHVRQIGTNTEPVYREEIRALKITGDQAKLTEVQKEAATKYPNVDWVAVANPPSPALPSYIQGQYTHDFLNNGFQDWDTFDLTGNKWLTPRESVFGGLETTRRFGFSDFSASGGINYPLAPRTSIVAQLSVSPTHHVLPTYSALLQLGQSLGDGWGAYIGEQHAHYDFATTDAQYVTLEKWIKLIRIADTVTLAEISGGKNGLSDTLQLNQYYGPNNQSTIGIGIGGGKTVVSLGAPRGVITATTTDVDLGGVHYVSPVWAGVYDFGYHKLGGIYIRRTVSFGLRRQF